MTILCVDISPYKNLCLYEISRQRVSFLLGRIHSEGWKTPIGIFTIINYHSLIIVAAVLLQNNSDNIFVDVLPPTKTHVYTRLTDKE